MCDWTQSKVEDLFKSGRGRVISGIEINNNPGIYPVYSSQTSNNGCMGHIATFDFEGELITWTTDGANAGTVFYRDGQFNCTNVCGTLKARKEEETDHRFFASLIGSHAKKHVSYIGNPKLMNREMGRIELSFPPVKEQRKIARILDTLDTTIRETEAIIAKLKSVKQGLLHDLLTRGLDENGELRLPQSEAPHLYKGSPLGWIPKEWDCITLGEIVSKSGGLLQTGPFGSQLHADEYTQEGVPVIMPQDMVQGEISEEYIARIPFRTAQNLLRHQVQLNDIVFSRRGDLSRCVAIENHQEGWICGTGCLLGRFSSQIINGYWLAQVYQQSYVQTQVLGRAVGSTMPNLNTSILASLLITCPPVREQNDVAERLHKLSDRLFFENRELEKRQKQKSGLMDDLLTGRVRVTPLLESAETTVDQAP